MLCDYEEERPFDKLRANGAETDGLIRKRRSP